MKYKKDHFYVVRVFACYAPYSSDDHLAAASAFIIYG